ncbi:hypothetical protein D3C85_1241060 [compost metagenome]
MRGYAYQWIHHTRDKHERHHQQAEELVCLLEQVAYNAKDNSKGKREHHQQQIDEDDLQGIRRNGIETKPEQPQHQDDAHHHAHHHLEDKAGNEGGEGGDLTVAEQPHIGADRRLQLAHDIPKKEKRQIAGGDK